MQKYLDLIRHVLAEGDWQDNRTGVRTISVPGAHVRFDLAEGFPALTTRKLAFKSAVGEICGFLRGCTQAWQFRDLGCKVWDQNANENAAWLKNPYRQGVDHLGDVYGAQWRSWPAYKVVADSNAEVRSYVTQQGFQPVARERSVHGLPYTVYHKNIDQLGDCVRTILRDPTNRRILFHGWNPATLDAIALPACHLLYQFHPNVTKKELSLSVYIRSNDLGLGMPFNVAECGVLLSLIAHLTGYTPRFINYTIGDAHIYENHLEMLEEQLKRDPLPAPQLLIGENVPRITDYEGDKHEQFGEDDIVAWLKLVQPGDFTLEGYEHHPAITAPMAV